MKSFPSIVFAAGVFAMGTGAHLVILAWARGVWSWVDRHARPLAYAGAALSALPSSSRQVLLATRNPIADWVNAGAMIELSFAVFVSAPLALLVVRDWRRARSTSARNQSAVPPVLSALPTPDAVAASDAAALDAARSPRDDAFTRRDALHTFGGAAVLGTTGAVLGWGATFGRHDYTLYEVAVRIAGLPKALDGYVIAQVSDIHAGLFVRERELREGFDLIRAMKPDLVVATGDLVDFDARDAPSIARALADLRARDGVFGILGNHDYYAGASRVLAEMERAGVTMLVNESRVVRPKDGGGFALIGVDDEWSFKFGGEGPKLDRAIRDLPDVPRILLAHQPQTIRRSAGRVALQLSGHTHGGQIRPANLFMTWSAGRYEKNGTTLYVNRGFGVAGPPARIGVPPEITKVVLVAA